MCSEHERLDAISDTSATGFTAYTPLSDTAKEHWDGNCYTVPWPDGIYMILEKSTKRAITIVDQTIFLQDPKDGEKANQEWHCVNYNNYFAFYNPATGRYIGHDGDSNLLARATRPKDWECITAKHHPSGGYQLSMPFYSDTLLVVTVGENGSCLVRRVHGTTLWEFVKV